MNADRTSRRPPARGDLDRLAAAAQGAIAEARWAEAEAALRSLIEALPAPQASLLYNLGLVVKRQGRLEAALAAFDAALAADPGHAKAAFERAAALMDLEDHAAAYEGFLAYLEAAPEDPDARLNAARLALRLGLVAAAAAQAEALERQRPEDPSTVLLLAEVAAERGDQETAGRNFAAVLRSGSPELRAAALAAMTHRPKGRIPLALDRLLDAGDQSAR
ncbi:MAG: tetratricopeptide repeat protein [Kiloniellales bacterium]|nr:tetratricopeptide repeat protein [Kiloniellales bacterium]